MCTFQCTYINNLFNYRLQEGLNKYYNDPRRSQDIDRLHRFYEKLQSSNSFCPAESLFANMNEFILTESELKCKYSLFISYSLFLGIIIGPYRPNVFFG